VFSYIQKQFATKHLHDGCIVLYDMTSTYFEGEYEDSSLVKYGYSRDCKRRHEQVNIGLLTNSEGCPIAVETFAGNTQDQITVKGQVKQIANDFNVKEVIFVGDRGMLTSKRIQEVNKEGFKTITALTRLQMQNLISRNIIKASSFKEDAYIEIQDPDSSEVRYILCLNPKRQKADCETRTELINATISQFDHVRNSKTKRSEAQIGSQVGKILAKYKTGKYFKWSIANGKLEYHLVQETINKNKSIDGCYIIRTDVASKILPLKNVYEAYKKLIQVEQAFRMIKTTTLEIRPVFHHLDNRIRAHIFLCMLSYYLQWHMNQRFSKVYKNDGSGENRRWSFQQIIERLKGIRTQEVTIGGVKVSDIISMPDKEQKMLLEALRSEL
jgi:transposase